MNLPAIEDVNNRTVKVSSKCRQRIKNLEFGIPLRNPGSKRKEINEATLRRLYVMLPAHSAGHPGI